MSMVMLIGAILGGMGSAMKGFQRLGSGRLGHPVRCMIALVPTALMSLLMSPTYPKLPSRMQACEKMISMGISDIYGSIPEGFS